MRWDGKGLLLSPLQGTARTLTPVGGAFFRAADRREATHVLLASADARVITDGFRSLERVRPHTVYAQWASASVGLASVLYLLLVGGVRSIKNLRRGTWRSEPLRWPAACLALLLVAPALYLTQSFLAVGDPTSANVTVALLTGLLPVTVIAAGVERVRSGFRARAARLDFLALAGVLQWCVVLAAWGLVPFALWR